ncbi:MAG: hypothetical protein V1660_02095 [archaeon]
MKRGLILWIFLVLFLIPLVPADTIPHNAVGLEFYVTYNNASIAEDFNAEIIMCGEDGNCSLKADNAEICKNSVCLFSYYRIERVPRQMKLLIHLNEETFSSDVINFSWTKSHLFYDVNLMPDDKVIITPSPNQENPDNSYAFWISFICALLLTIAIEFIVSIIFFKKWKISSKKWKKPLLTVAIADIISVPLVWLIFFLIVAALPSIFSWLSIIIAMIIAEAFAVVFEGYILFNFNKKILPMKKAFLLSIIMNLASFILGGIILGGLLAVLS